MLIEPTVEKWVAACGGHCKAVTACEAECVPLPTMNLEIEVLRQVDDVKRQPADYEDKENSH